jgi:hypothetical protein
MGVQPGTHVRPYINNSPSVAEAIVAVPSNASTATSGEQRAKALTHGKCKQSVAIAVTTPAGSVGALGPKLTLSYQMQAWAAPWVTTRPSGVGLPNNEHGCQSTRVVPFRQRCFHGAMGLAVSFWCSRMYRGQPLKHARWTHRRNGGPTSQTSQSRSSLGTKAGRRLRTLEKHRDAYSQYKATGSR